MMERTKEEVSRLPNEEGGSLEVHVTNALHNLIYAQ